MSILNDVLPSANPNGNNQDVWRGRDRFGIEASDVTFVPYWDKNSGLSCAGDLLYASAWRKPGALLAAIVNRGESTTASVHLDVSKLGLPTAGPYQAVDADTGGDLSMSADGSISIPIERHDYRQILITASPK